MARAGHILKWWTELRQSPSPIPVTLISTSTTAPIFRSSCIFHHPYRNASTSSRPDSSLSRHVEKVHKISSEVKKFYDAKEKFRIYHGSTNSTRPRDQSHKRNIVDTSSLDEVIDIRTTADNATITVEPNVPMDRLVEATLDHNLIPKVVMEFPGITVGGGYSGTSGESSSFRHGFFDQTVNKVEMVLADGQVVNASREENADLFHGAAGALGTLGITTQVEIQLIPAKRYVEVEYWPVTSVRHAMECISQAISDESVDYVDGILYSQTSGVIVIGRMSNSSTTSDTPIQTFSKPSDPWFYMHVQNMLSRSSESGKPIRELIPLPEYLFRYDRAGFWVGRSAFSHMHFPCTPLTRRWLDDFLHTRMLYLALHASGQSRTYFVQDLAMPYHAVEEFVQYTDVNLGIWPLWLCPLKQSKSPTMHPHYPLREESSGHSEEKPELLMNIGLWGTNPTISKSYDAFVEANRALERKLTELGGMKWLYAHTYYSEKDFWSQFDKQWYDDLRKKYGAHETLPSVYDKVSINVQAQQAEMNSFKNRLLNIWPVGAAWGIRKAIQSGTYVEARNSKWKQWRSEVV